MREDHLCKPKLEHSPPQSENDKSSFERWTACIKRLSEDPNVYMKLSGSFSEMQKQEPAAPWAPSKVMDVMRPWLDQLFKYFTPDRIMFGSDWPVCNVGGPGIELSWTSWTIAVDKMLANYSLTEEQKDSIWYRTAMKAYRM